MMGESEISLRKYSEEKSVKEDSINEKSSKEKFKEANFDIPRLPKLNVYRDFLITKRYFQKLGEGNDSLWEHLTDIIHYVVENQPQNCMKQFEAMCRSLKIKKFRLDEDTFETIYESPINLCECIYNLKLYGTVKRLSKSENPYVDDTVSDPSMLFNFRLLNDCGVGIPQCDLFNIYMAIRALAKMEPLQKVRLWGIIFGIEKNYIIVEGELLPEALSGRIAEYENNRKSEVLKKIGNKVKKVQIEEIPIEIIPGNVGEHQDFENVPPQMDLGNIIGETGEALVDEASVIEKPKTKLHLYIKPPVPLPPVVEEIEVPRERPGEGVNRKVYYVSNRPGDQWIMLPDITPKQIVIGRKIKRFFKGNLDAEVETYPEFPGTEKDFLRVQIARISATTQVSPVGYFEGESEEETTVRLREGELYAENLDYQPIPISELLDSSLEFWVHHSQYILNQGRTSYWAPPPKEHEGEFEGEAEAYLEPEIPPRLLRALSRDDALPSGDSPWSIRRTSNFFKDKTAIMIRSNIWPGALSVIKERNLQYLYVGWGFKSTDEGFSPPLPGPIQTEYESGPEIMEMDDPTAEMEEAVRKRKEEKTLMREMGRGGMGEEEQTEEPDTDLN